MVKVLAGMAAVLWGASVAAYGFVGDPALRGGVDAVGLAVSLLLALALLGGGGRVLALGLRERRGR